jgi:hypothetical protein
LKHVRVEDPLNEVGTEQILRRIDQKKLHWWGADNSHAGMEKSMVLEWTI